MNQAIPDERVISAVTRWVETVVVALNLCPFAGRELQKGRVRFTVTAASTDEQLLLALKDELDLLDRDEMIETTVLIHPAVLQDFHDYNQFLDLADHLLAGMKLDGIYQVASFHPDYCFANTLADDAENFTNRSPYPMLHILREASVERAISSHPDIDQIPQRNIERMNELGADKLRLLVARCFEGN